MWIWIICLGEFKANINAIKQASKPQLQELIDQVQAEMLLHEA